jgi:hypothetical protein
MNFYTYVDKLQMCCAINLDRVNEFFITYEREKWMIKFMFNDTDFTCISFNDLNETNDAFYHIVNL